MTAGHVINNGTLTRRNFLKLLGSISAVSVAGCAEKPGQQLLPFVKGNNARITGIPILFRSTCGECAAGCGTEIITREGRAVKLEGNRDNPINKGSLCALGQSAVQHLYDPDRIREPLAKTKDVLGNDTFTPISWDEALNRVAKALSETGKRKGAISGIMTGGLLALQKEWTDAFSVERVSYDLMEPASLAEACQVVFGTRRLPKYEFGEADFILSFGADFLETWISPVEFTREFAKRRGGIKPSRFVQIEPRLSLTGANADLWLAANPGSETVLALLFLKSAISLGKGGGLSREVKISLEPALKGITLDRVEKETGIPRKRLEILVKYMMESKAPLILAGGSGTRTRNPLPLQVAALYLNAALGVIGRTCIPGAARVCETDVNGVRNLVDACARGEVSSLFVFNANPAYNLPFFSSVDGNGASFAQAVKRVDTVVSFSSHLDETAAAAHIIIPLHTSLEAWGDNEPQLGVYTLQQPCMAPVYDTKDLGDILLVSAKKAGRTIGGGALTFPEYLRSRWDDIFKREHPAERADGEFWSKSLERGGFFKTVEPAALAPKPIPQTASRAGSLNALDQGAEDESLLLYPFFSGRMFDGRGGNRPWLLELPDPMTHIVWGAWAELHPETAAKFGIGNGEGVAVKTENVEIRLPVHLNPHLHRDLVAVPMGFGHMEFGRYAKQAEGGNVVKLLPAGVSTETGEAPLLVTRVKLEKSALSARVVRTQESFEQAKGSLARVLAIDTSGRRLKEDLPHGSGHPENPKQMYDQRAHPLYHWGMAIDLAACTGCSACMVACSAENNVPMVGKTMVWEGREMFWIRIDRYEDSSSDEPLVRFMPMLCQQCNNAPCEVVCPVFATYHNEEGLNAMVYNRCVGTRYCSNNCPYKARRFNWRQLEYPEPLNWQLNPEVTRRNVGVMEKCTFCVQRIIEAKDRAKDLGRMVQDGEIQPACVQTCPAKAITFGNLSDPESAVSKLHHDKRAYKLLDAEINTQPSIAYLDDVKTKLS